MKHIIILLVSLALFSCKEEESSWQLTETIELIGINPIGIAPSENGFWISDGDHNRVVRINELGEIKASIDSLDRPMHIASDGGELLIPQYGNDLVMSWNKSESNILKIKDSLDAPAGIWKNGDEIAIADFYNNRILYSKDGTDWSSFGKEGKGDGEFYYPTDVQITSDKIYVADAYNNRIQVFDKTFKFERIIGADQHMNATTGIYVDDNYIFATDFENDRVLVFDMDGMFIQELKDMIEKPTDLLYENDKLYVLNYRNSLMNIFELKKVKN